MPRRHYTLPPTSAAMRVVSGEPDPHDFGKRLDDIAERASGRRRQRNLIKAWDAVSPTVPAPLAAPSPAPAARTWLPGP